MSDSSESSLLPERPRAMEGIRRLTKSLWTSWENMMKVSVGGLQGYALLQESARSQCEVTSNFDSKCEILNKTVKEVFSWKVEPMFFDADDDDAILKLCDEPTPESSGDFYAYKTMRRVVGPDDDNWDTAQIRSDGTDLERQRRSKAWLCFVCGQPTAFTELLTTSVCQQCRNGRQMARDIIVDAEGDHRFSFHLQDEEAELRARNPKEMKRLDRPQKLSIFYDKPVEFLLFVKSSYSTKWLAEFAREVPPAFLQSLDNRCGQVSTKIGRFLRSVRYLGLAPMCKERWKGHYPSPETTSQTFDQIRKQRYLTQRFARPTVLGVADIDEQDDCDDSFPTDTEVIQHAIAKTADLSRQRSRWRYFRDTTSVFDGARFGTVVREETPRHYIDRLQASERGRIRNQDVWEAPPYQGRPKFFAWTCDDLVDLRGLPIADRTFCPRAMLQVVDLNVLNPYCWYWFRSSQNGVQRHPADAQARRVYESFRHVDSDGYYIDVHINSTGLRPRTLHPLIGDYRVQASQVIRAHDRAHPRAHVPDRVQGQWMPTWFYDDVIDYIEYLKHYMTVPWTDLGRFEAQLDSDDLDERHMAYKNACRYRRQMRLPNDPEMRGPDGRAPPPYPLGGFESWRLRTKYWVDKGHQPCLSDADEKKILKCYSETSPAEQGWHQPEFTMVGEGGRMDTVLAHDVDLSDTYNFEHNMNIARYGGRYQHVARMSKLFYLAQGSEYWICPCYCRLWEIRDWALGLYLDYEPPALPLVNSRPEMRGDARISVTNLQLEPESIVTHCSEALSMWHDLHVRRIPCLRPWIATCVHVRDLLQKMLMGSMNELVLPDQITKDFHGRTRLIMPLGFQYLHLDILNSFIWFKYRDKFSIDDEGFYHDPEAMAPQYVDDNGQRLIPVWVENWEEMGGSEDYFGDHTPPAVIDSQRSFRSWKAELEDLHPGRTVEGRYASSAYKLHGSDRHGSSLASALTEAQVPHSTQLPLDDWYPKSNLRDRGYIGARPLKIYSDSELMTRGKGFDMSSGPVCGTQVWNEAYELRVAEIIAANSNQRAETWSVSRPGNATLNNNDPIPPMQGLIRVNIGPKAVKVLLDTGAMLSMIRETVADQLRKHEKTKGFISQQVPLRVPLNCEGAEKDRVIGRITAQTTVTMLFAEPEIVDPDGRDSSKGNDEYRKWRSRGSQTAETKVTFHELAQLADPIIIGLPELQRLGLVLEPIGVDGVGWVQFAGLGIRLPLLGTKVGAKINVIHPMLFTSDEDFATVEVVGWRADIEEAAR